jgi:RHS repeat-associated protein
LVSNNILNPGLSDYLNFRTNYISGRPKAYVNWVLLDEQFKFVAASSGYTLIGKKNLEPVYGGVLPVSKNGYFYVFVSNETPNIDVFFDNFVVTHIRGPLVAEDHYYPFGLTMNGISSQALNFGNPENKYKYNDGSEIENKEFVDGSGLEMYNTTYRNLDPQIGRFWQTDPLGGISHNFSPYSYGNNNPIFLNDPSGLFSDSLHPVVGQVATVYCKLPKKLDSKNGQVLPKRGIFGRFFGSPRKWVGHVPVNVGNNRMWLPKVYEVNNDGYLTGRLAPDIFEVPSIGFSSPSNLRAIFRLKNFIKGEYSIYQAVKKGLPYFGKAKNGLNARYTLAEIEEIQARVIRGLESIPNNAVALGVEQLVMDLNGGVESGLIANKMSATIKQIYVNEARWWLDQNLPNWEQVLKFK